MQNNNIEHNDLSNNLLYEILQELRRNRVGDELWTIKDMSNYTQLSRASLQQRIINKADFPRAVLIKTTATGGAKRWLKTEVINYFTQHKIED